MSDPQFSSLHRGNYSDRFVVLDGACKMLTVKHWLLARATLRVPVEDILNILPAPEATHKTRGLGLTGVAWARDFRRIMRAGFDSSFVMRYLGGFLRAGFTVENRQAFLSALEATVPGVTGRGKEKENPSGA